MDFKYNGIVINKKDVAETDRIYTILTKESGKIKVLAKSVRRPAAKLAGHLEPFTYSEIFLAKSRGLGKITSSIVIDNFSGIKNDIDSLLQASIAAKKLDQLVPEQQEDVKIFEYFLDYLRTLEGISRKSAPEKKAILTLGFIFNLLSESGYRMEMKKCVSCGKNLKLGGNSFSASLGGVLCADCQGLEKTKMAIESSSIKFIRIFSQNKLRSLIKLNSSKKDLQNLEKILQEAASWILG